MRDTYARPDGKGSGPGAAYEGNTGLTRISMYYLRMQGGLAITIVTFLALSALVPEHRHFVPRPTAPMPAVNVPF